MNSKSRHFSTITAFVTLTLQLTKLEANVNPYCGSVSFNQPKMHRLVFILETFFGLKCFKVPSVLILTDGFYPSLSDS